ncbi:MAG: redox-regulated ATPase YchF [Armatimonadetes bacterium]|nr:redox-regulated ATPase YchF [Armatimonadota bacterium]
MKVAMIGYAQCGRSTLYRAAAGGSVKGDFTAVPVPDERFDTIVQQVQPKKQTPATLILHDDLDSVATGGKAFSQKLIDQAKKADLLLHVVRAFENPISPYHAEVDPQRDCSNLEVEIVLSDLQIIENRLERLQKSTTVKTPGSTDYLDKVSLEKFKAALEEGRPIRSLDLTEDDQNTIKSYQFLSAKPMVVCFNVNESDAGSPTEAVKKAMAGLAEIGTESFVACATIEEEIAQLDPADQGEFLASLGLTVPASHLIVRAVYDALGLITFFTAGENDTRAWPLRRGSSALKAAATIHNDIAKGFIRAEIVHYADYVAAGSLDAAYSAGKMSLEGKEYVIQDGDLLHIRNKS